MKQTGYSARSDFNSDMAKHNAIDDKVRSKIDNSVNEVRSDIATGKVKSKEAATKIKSYMQKAIEHSRAHAQYDDSADKAFNEAINDTGAVHDTFAHKQAMSDINYSLAHLKSVQGNINDADMPNKDDISDTIDDSIDVEKDIRDKMEVVENNKADKKNGWHGRVINRQGTVINGDVPDSMSMYENSTRDINKANRIGDTNVYQALKDLR